MYCTVVIICMPEFVDPVMYCILISTRRTKMHAERELSCILLYCASLLNEVCVSPCCCIASSSLAKIVSPGPARHIKMYASNVCVVLCCIVLPLSKVCW